MSDGIVMFKVGKSSTLYQDFLLGASSTNLIISKSIHHVYSSLNERKNDVCYIFIQH